MKYELEYEIMNTIAQLNSPAGASFLSSKIDSSQASIGRILNDLEQRGMLEKISNKGRILTAEGWSYLELRQKDIESKEYVDILFDLFSKNEKQIYLDILECRIILEQKTAYLAAERITAAQLFKLEKILIMHKSTRSLGKPAEEENLNFHYKIAEYAGNPVLLHLLKLLMKKNAAYVHFSVMDSFTGSNLFHGQIFEAIRMHNPEKASALMGEHLQALLEKLKHIDNDSFFDLMPAGENQTADLSGRTFLNSLPQQ